MRVSRFIDDDYRRQLADLPVTKTEEGAKPVNICGVLVHAKLAKLQDVRRDLCQLPGVEIHAETEDGRLILTIEDTETGTAAESLAAAGQVSGVLSAVLVYHEFQPEDALAQEETPA
ncbi:MAG: chaperone NapD [Magnetospiraceae bacterium]